jgi:hypothetical protein
VAALKYIFVAYIFTVLIYREVHTFVDRFMVAGAPLAARRKLILPMNQHA